MALLKQHNNSSSNHLENRHLVQNRLGACGVALFLGAHAINSIIQLVSPAPSFARAPILPPDGLKQKIEAVAQGANLAIGKDADAKKIVRYSLDVSPYLTDVVEAVQACSIEVSLCTIDGIFHNGTQYPMVVGVGIPRSGNPNMRPGLEGLLIVDIDSTIWDNVRFIADHCTTLALRGWEWIVLDRNMAIDSTKQIILERTGLSCDTTDVGGIGRPALPAEFRLLQNYPNPFNSSTTIAFEVPKRAHVKIRVYDVTGRRVVTLVDETKTAGEYSAVFNADGLPSGMYLCKFEVNGFSETKKMMLIK
jgi:hypothetical protein